MARKSTRLISAAVSGALHAIPLIVWQRKSDCLCWKTAIGFIGKTWARILSVPPRNSMASNAPKFSIRTLTASFLFFPDISI